MEKDKKSNNILKKIAILLSSVGPGLFLIGYNIGTGSVTTMASAGSRYGMSLFWALFLSCVFTFIMLIAYGKYTLVTGNTALYGFKRYFRYGKIISMAILIILVIGELVSVTGVMGIVVEIIQEWSKFVTSDGKGFNQIAITVVIIIFLYYIFWIGKYNLFEKVLIVFVSMMGLSFILSMILVIPEPSIVIKGLVPRLPDAPKAHLIAAGMAGTTLAAPLLVMRSIVVSEKGWRIDKLKIETRDAFVSVTAMLIISGAIMACAAGTLYPKEIGVDRVVHMVMTLEPLAGRFAMSIFVAGIVSAGLSTVFPLILITPWLICDYMNIPRNIQSPLFRILGAFGLLLGFVVPVFGGRPVWIMIASQAFQVTAVPAVVLAIIILLNNRNVMGKYKIGFWMNLGCFLTFAFSLVMSYTGIIGLIDFF